MLTMRKCNNCKTYLLENRFSKSRSGNYVSKCKKCAAKCCRESHNKTAKYALAHTLKYLKDRFFVCDVCQYQSTNQWHFLSHINSKRHLRNETNL